MENEKIKNKNLTSRILTTIGLFWTLVSPLLGFTFFIAGFAFAASCKETKEGIRNLIFAIISTLLAVFYIIFSLIGN